ncbi:MAG: hypothetical protein KAR42_09090 [candidate division Zixibacteria bacterium]|nr:hypothetical protein [candidate division Zixibacteria bacterium]
MKSNSYNDQNYTINPIIVTALGLMLVLVRFIHLVLPEGRIWGFNHLQFLPDATLIPYLCCFLLLFLFLIKSFNKAVLQLFESLGFLFSGKKQIKWMLFSVVLMILFWILKMPTHFLGDGYTVIGHIGSDNPVMYKWTEIGSIAVVKLVYSILPVAGKEGGETAFAVVSVLSGGVTVFFLCGIAFEITQENINRLFILALSIFSGWMLLFMGYAENYPLLWASISGYVYFSLKYINKNCGIIWPVLLALLAIVMHLQSLFFLISMPVLLIAINPGRKLFEKYKTIFLIGASVLIAGGAVLFFYKYFTSPGFEVHFLPLFSGRAPATEYALISISHMLDIINEFSLLVPLWPILLYFAIKNRKANGKSPARNFLWVFFIGGLGLILILDPRIGMGRDWDLFSLCGFALLLLLLASMNFGNTRHKQFIPAITILSFLLILPYFFVNLQTKPSIDYYTYLLKLDTPKSKTGYVVLQDYYLNLGDSAQANSTQMHTRQIFPEITYLRQAEGLNTAGKYAEALPLAHKLVNIEPYKAGSYALRGVTYLNLGQLKKSESDLKLALEFEPYSSINHANLGVLYFKIKDYYRMFQYYNKALKIDPEYHRVTEAMATAYFTLQKYDSALVYYEKMTSVLPERLENYVLAGYSAYYVKDGKKAEKYLTYYLEQVPDSPQKDNIEKALKSMK